MAEMDLSTVPVKPVTPVIGINSSTGVGKSREMLHMIATYSRSLRAQDNKGTAVVFLPTHKLGEELVEKFNVEYPDLTARRFLGITQEDPNQPGENMCHRDKLVTDLCKDGASLKELCAKPRKGQFCPHHVDVADKPCGYSLQSEQSANVWFLPQQKLFRTAPRCVRSPALIFIDESFWQSSLEGFNPPYRFKLETLINGRGTNSRFNPLCELGDTSLTVYDQLIREPDGFIDVDVLNTKLGTHAIEICREAYRLEMSRLEKVRLRPDMSKQFLNTELDKLKGMAVMRLASAHPEMSFF